MARHFHLALFRSQFVVTEFARKVKHVVLVQGSTVALEIAHLLVSAALYLGLFNLLAVLPGNAYLQQGAVTVTQIAVASLGKITPVTELCASLAS